MKRIFLILSAVSLSFAANASFAPTEDCSNLNSTIEIDMVSGTVKVLTSMHPQPTYETFTSDQIEIKEQVITQLKGEEYGQTSTANRFSRIVISKKSGSAMPHAYNNLAKGGKLVDDYICSERSSW